MENANDALLFERNDYGNAQRLEFWFRNDFIFTSRGWHYWEGHRWSSGGLDGERELRVRAAAKFSELLEIVDESQKDVRRFFLQCGNVRSLNAAMQIAERFFKQDATIFDTNPWLLNFNNGTYDLRLNLFRGHLKTDYITKTCGYAFANLPDDFCPNFKRLITDSMGNDLEKAEFLFRYLGYCLTGCTHEEIVLLNHGYGSNGKTTLSNLMLKVMGDYATSANVQTFLENKQSRSNSPRPDLMDLIGMRFVCASEPPKGQGLDEALIKQLIGGEEKKDRNNYDRELTRYTPCMKLILSYNLEPTIKDSGFGFWKRVRKLDWPMRFERNEAFKKALFEETQAIAACLIRACQRWRESGLLVPLSVQQSTDEYASDQDEVSQFIDECVDVFEGTSISNVDLWHAWETYCNSHGIDKRSHKFLSQSLKQLGHKQLPGRTHGRKWDKLTLKNHVPKDDDERNWRDD